jgi:hypothetical protein
LIIIQAADRLRSNVRAKKIMAPRRPVKREDFILTGNFLTIPDSKPSQKPSFASCAIKLQNELSPFIHRGFRRFS